MNANGALACDVSLRDVLLREASSCGFSACHLLRASAACKMRAAAPVFGEAVSP
jgi:hypothetical protein